MANLTSLKEDYMAIENELQLKVLVLCNMKK